tara:strand:- start:2931 stop:3218 length:288 start_codon:yes stop_codon:yes gene_type:complete
MKKLLKTQNNFQLFIVLIVFAITGSLSLYLSEFILDFLNVNQNNMSKFLYWSLRILVLFPVYQLLLILIGTLFGQFSYFWEFEKKFLKKIGININ